MKTSNPPSARAAVVATLASLALSLPASAVVTIDWVTVGDINNLADTRVMNDGTTGYGSVGHVYNIGKNEVTISQYTEFLNAVAKTDTYNLYNSIMATSALVAGISRSGTAGSYVYSAMGDGNRPVTYVSWFDAARFCNWMHNGQGSATTENGVYNLNGAASGTSFMPQPDATIWIPTEDEWYKAAYYDPSKNDGAGGYWQYPTRSDTLGGNTIGAPHSANYFDDNQAKYQNNLPSFLTPVGAYGANSASYYGTNDQGGNVWEWNDAVIDGDNRGMRGGAWDSFWDSYYLRYSARLDYNTYHEYYNVGFRVAGVPEPTALLLTMLGGACALFRRSLIQSRTPPARP